MKSTTEPRWVRGLLIAVSLAFVSAFLALPVAAVVFEAFHEGTKTFKTIFADPTTMSAIKLTLVSTAIAVPINVVFGVAAAWLVTRFDFKGKSLLVTLIDVPVTVSPVIAGMLFILLFGAQTGIGALLFELDLQVLFAPPAIVIATLFVTFPYVARELIPLWAEQGVDEEQAAMVLGASGWTMFFRITLPKAKWALLHGIVLSTARALGEFGAVSVVSGHIRGQTNTMPLAVEALYNEYRFADAFAVATLLLSLAAVSLVFKRLVIAKARSEHQVTTVTQADDASLGANSTQISPS